MIDDRCARHCAAGLDEIGEVGLDGLDPARQIRRAMASDRTNAKATIGQLAGDRAPDRPGTDDDVEFRLGHIWLLIELVMSTVFTSGSMHHEVNDVNIGRR